MPPGAAAAHPSPRTAGPRSPSWASWRGRKGEDTALTSGGPPTAVGPRIVVTDGQRRESYRPAIARRQRNASVGERAAIVHAFTRDGEPSERVDLTRSSSTTGYTPCEFAALGIGGLKPYRTGS
jgi:hypothetical protein